MLLKALIARCALTQGYGRKGFNLIFSEVAKTCSHFTKLIFHLRVELDELRKLQNAVFFYIGKCFVSSLQNKQFNTLVKLVVLMAF